MRKMSNATVHDMGRLKRAVRYLKTLPRIISRYPWGAMTKTIEVYTDSDHAGCPTTRRSTLGGCILWGGCYLKGWSKTMEILALSSGESELGALVRACTEGLGMKALIADFQRKVDIVIKSDATAAIGMARRLGLGRVR